ncbi:lytic transglycosylase domain-containing protein [Psychrobacter sp. YGAH215]|uniref:lytic transglycosylase domain-containing protein n=1 Tax=Psychrobacter sp. YGAH215 TaxID=2596826 RepID=UPI001680A70B|nr:lytic transglycosylase domain-containing protein [Psychrobacter sp. YGAH215]
MSNLNPEVTAHNTPKVVNASNSKKGRINDYNKTKLDQVIEYNANKYDVSPALIRAIIRQESNFNTLAVSPKGARGLMQVLPSTAKNYGSYDLFLPHHNVEVGSRHFSRLMKKYKQLPLALAAYNAGEGNVSKYNGIPPFLETQKYVLNVLKSYNAGLDKQIYGIDIQSQSDGSKVLVEQSVIGDKTIEIIKAPKVLYFSIDR